METEKEMLLPEDAVKASLNPNADQITAIQQFTKRVGLYLRPSIFNQHLGSNELELYNSVPEVESTQEKELLIEIDTLSKKIGEAIKGIQTFIDSLKEKPPIIEEKKDSIFPLTPHISTKKYKSKNTYETIIEEQSDKLTNKFRFAISSAINERIEIMNKVRKIVEYSPLFYQEMDIFIGKCFQQARDRYFEWTPIKTIKLEAEKENIHE